ncbi:hypothetical protein [Szabonella alba]|uniref:Uncharacterized protein n=1 Tax=Szabonella alba TaxID=2804194 RepID=A0A8K0Y139_9RHOB|nr:hypothetical protein [Szabonella alba]MBL4918900.1 hypothetical protein [Szabonella alba]
MNRRAIPFPGQPPAQPPYEEEPLSHEAKELAEQIAAEPVPERLRMMAAELGRALDARQKDSDRDMPSDTEKPAD